VPVGLREVVTLTGIISEDQPGVSCFAKGNLYNRQNHLTLFFVPSCRCNLCRLTSGHQRQKSNAPDNGEMSTVRVCHRCKPITQSTLFSQFDSCSRLGHSPWRARNSLSFICRIVPAWCFTTGNFRPFPALPACRPRFLLPHFRFSRILKGMEVHFSPDVETRLQQVASANGKDAEQLVKDTVARMLENQARFIAGVQKGIEQADRGEFVEHKDVLNRIDRLFHS
jgi:predicted transcriptional regulator